MLFRRNFTRRTLVVVLILTLVAVSISTISPTRVSADPGEIAPAGVGRLEGGITKTVAQLMAEASALDPSFAREAPIMPRLPIKAQDPFAPMKSDVAELHAVNEAVSTSDSGSLNTVQRSFSGPTYSGWTPPDTMGAVSTTQFLAVLNGVITVYDLNGVVGSLNMTLDSFFSSVRNGASTGDPRVRYDRLSGRWFVIAFNIVSTNNRVVIAVSNGSTITSTSSFSFYFFTQSVGGTPTNVFLDYPTLGVDANAIYIGANMFGSTVTTDLYTLPKANLIAGTGVVYHFVGLGDASAGTGMWTPQPADNQYDPSATVGYVVGTDMGFYSRIRLLRVNNPGGSPTITSQYTINTSTTYQPLTVPHFGNTGGTNGYLDGLDDRLIHSFVRGGKVYTTHTTRANSAGAGTAAGDRDMQRLYGIGNINGTPTLDEERWVYYSTADPIHIWMGSIAANGRGERLYGYSTAGANYYVNGGVYRLSSTIGGTDFSSNYTNNTSRTYNPSYDSGAGRGSRRWGDYSHTMVDLCDDSSFWTIQEAPAAGNQWGTYVAKVLGAPPGSISVSPSVIPRWKPSINLTITGSRLWDPGSGFGCRISAAIPGVTVNYILYYGPTQIVVNVSTMVSSTGAKTLTVTNPDGQTTSAGVTVTAGTVDTIGIYRPSNSTFYLRNSNTTGPADIAAVLGSGATDRPVVGDWDGDGIDTIGVYRQTTAAFYLKNANTTGAAIAYAFSLGAANDVPFAGDWNISGRDGVGVFRPSNGQIYLKNTLATGFADYAMVFGTAGDIPVAGDWNNGGQDSPGIYRPSQSRFYLTDQVINGIPVAGYIFNLGNPNTDVPFAGDWNGDGGDSVGVFRPANGITYMRNALSTGFADIAIVYGITNDRPVAGNWAVVGGVLAPEKPADAAPIFNVGK